MGNLSWKGGHRVPKLRGYGIPIWGAQFSHETGKTSLCLGWAYKQSASINSQNYKIQDTNITTSKDSQISLQLTNGEKQA